MKNFLIKKNCLFLSTLWSMLVVIIGANDKLPTEELKGQQLTVVK